MATNFTEIGNKDGFDHVVQLAGTAAATAANYGFLITASRAFELIKIKVRYSAASSSGTLQLERLTGTTALGSGTTVLTTPISLSATANTTYEFDVTNFVRNTNQLRENESFALVDGGLLVGLTDLSLTFYFFPQGKGEYT